MILYEDRNLRGRLEGQIFDMLGRGLAKGRRVRSVENIHGEAAAIALALRADCPIYVNEEVIKASQKNAAAEEEGGEESTLGEEDWPDVIGEAGDLPM